MPRLPYFLLVVLLLLPDAVHAQYQSAPVWTFGHHAGLDFTSGAPVPITTSIYTHSTVASTQCDAQGNVLFYANSFRIWDKNGNPMSNSQNPVITGFHASGWNLNAMIVPHATDTNLYYVFNTFPSNDSIPWGPYYAGQLTYSLVDMSLNGGLGDVVAGKNHVLLDNNTGHYMTIVPGRHCNYWLIVQQGQSTSGVTFRTYEIDGNGINATPVVTYFPLVQSLFPVNPPSAFSPGARAGSYTYSYTRDKLIAGYESADITAYDFDRITGKFSAGKTITWAYPAVAPVSSATLPAICLSPDESQLYVLGTATTTNGYELRQFPLTGSGPTFAAGPATVITTVPQQYLMITQSTGFAWTLGAMQLGPDNKIYIAYTMGQDFLGRIENPNVAGPGCGHTLSALQLAPNTYTTSGLPAPMYTRKTPVYNTLGTRQDTTICDQPQVTLSAPDASYTYYTWHNGSSGLSYDAVSSGMYIVTAGNGDCNLRNDTFDVTMTNYMVSLGADAQTCDSVYMYPFTNAPQPISYTWQDGSTNPLYIAGQPGTYAVTVTSNGCSVSDTIDITEGSLPISLPADTTICDGEALRLIAGNIPGASYLWQDGDTSSIYNATGEGLHIVTATKGICSTSDSIVISRVDCSTCKAFIPAAFTPNGDGRNDGFRPLFSRFCHPDDYDFRVYNRYGQMVFRSFNASTPWNGSFNNRPADLGTYMYHLSYHINGKKYSEKGDVVLVR